MSISKVLVTGGCGFIGSHTVDALVMDGYEVGVIDNLSTGKKRNIQGESGHGHNVRFHRCDIRNYEKAAGIVRRYDAVIHAAAIVDVGRSINDPLLTDDVNVRGTLNLLQASRRAHITKFIFSSSAAVYGETQDQPVKESAVLIPTSPYGVTKVAGEQYCKVFTKIFGVQTVCLRYFNVYGPRQTARGDSGVIAKFANAMTNEKSPVIYGNGEQTRDFVFVKDVARANLLALEVETEDGGAFNIGSGKGTTINTIFRYIQRLLGKPHLAPIYEKAKKGDVRSSLADISKARRVLGYSTNFDVEQGLGETLTSKVTFPWISDSSPLT